MNKLSRRSLVKTSLSAMLATGIVSTARAADSADNEGSEKVYDVVIIGCGCAGMAAAIEAKKAGASPVILEKMSRPSGNTIYSGGIINATNTYVQKQQGVKDTLEDFYNDMMKVSLGRGDAELTRMYVEKSGEQIQWLTDVCGVKFRPLENEVWPMLQRG
ncbi:FAD-dependent oxidoreductase, partial [Parasutterella excrementihominis]